MTASADKPPFDMGTVILAGGKSRRMGRDKCSIKLGSKTLLEHVIANVVGFSRLVVVVTAAKSSGATERQRGLPVAWTTDRREDAGPLEGLRCGLQHLRDHQLEAALVIGCDYPLFGWPIARILANRLADHQAICVQAGKHWSPLPMVVRTHALSAANDLLAQGHRALHDLLKHIDCHAIMADELRTVEPDLHSLLNVNDPEALKRVQNWIARSAPDDELLPGDTQC